MDSQTFTAVLLAALMHAAWNAIAKRGKDPLVSVTAIHAAMGMIALGLLPLFPMPSPAAWPYLAASVVFHIAYNVTLARAYSLGDMAVIYPLARGAAPLITTLIALALLAEYPSSAAWAGIALVVFGVYLIAMRGNHDGAERADRGAVIAALTVSVCIAVYTVLDGAGGRVSGSPSGYAMWLLTLNGAGQILAALAWRGRAILSPIAASWRDGFIGGIGALGAYWIIIWAMSRAPIASVAALRETSILFAVLISAMLLREPMTRWRIGAAISIVAGAAALRLS